MFHGRHACQGIVKLHYANDCEEFGYDNKYYLQVVDLTDVAKAANPEIHARMIPTFSSIGVTFCVHTTSCTKDTSILHLQRRVNPGLSILVTKWWIWPMHSLYVIPRSYLPVRQIDGHNNQNICANLKAIQDTTDISSVNKDIFLFSYTWDWSTSSYLIDKMTKKLWFSLWQIFGVFFSRNHDAWTARPAVSMKLEIFVSSRDGERTGLRSSLRYEVHEEAQLPITYCTVQAKRRRVCRLSS